MKDPLAQFAERIAERKQAIDAEFAPLIRNHLVQLFRKAHAVDPELTGAIFGMGAVSPKGFYICKDGEKVLARDYFYCNFEPEHAATKEWLATLSDYSENYLCAQHNGLPYVSDITVDDLLSSPVRERKGKLR
jgi:hypothetical protein